jgi:hypothetical protein
MTPKALQLYNFLERNAAEYDAIPDGASPERIANRREWARLLRVAAAAVAKEGQTTKLARVFGEAAE